MDKLKKDVVRIYFLLCDLRRILPQEFKEVRCHESAEIFYEVLKNLGYTDIEIVNGFYLLSDSPNRGRGKQHSWVEIIIPGPPTKSLLIETAPRQFSPELPLKELISKMVIPSEDVRRQRYAPMQDTEFFQILKQLGVKSAERQLVKLYSSLIIQKLKELSKKVNKNKKDQLPKL